MFVMNATLANALSFTRDHLAAYGDSPVHAGQFVYSTYTSLVLAITGADPRVLMWSMVSDAVAEFFDWETSTQLWVGAQFSIFHGSTLVGSGVLQVRAADP